MAFHDNTAHARRNIGTESAASPSPITKRNAAGEYATTIGITNFRVSSALSGALRTQWRQD